MTRRAPWARCLRGPVVCAGLTFGSPSSRCTVRTAALPRGRRSAAGTDPSGGNRRDPRGGLGDTVRMAGPDDAAGDLPVTGSVVVPAAALSWRFSRSSGPGGQGVNTADSRVELSVAPLELPGLGDSQRQRLTERLGNRLVDGVLTIAASEHRQQLRNRQAARERLAAVLRAALAPPPPSRRRTKPTRGSQERRIEAKKQRGQLKKQRRDWDLPPTTAWSCTVVHTCPRVQGA